MKFVVDPESRNLFGKNNEDIDNVYDAYIYKAKQIMIWVLIVAAIMVTVCMFFTDNEKLQCVSLVAFLFVGISCIIAMMVLLENENKIIGKKLPLTENEVNQFRDLKKLTECDGKDIYKVNNQYYYAVCGDDSFLFSILEEDDLKSLQNRYSQSEIDEATTLIARMKRNKETNQYEVVYDLV